MAFRQAQKNSQKQKVSLSPQLIEAVTANEKSDLEIRNIIELERLADAFLEEAPLKFGDEEGVRDVDDDGRVNEDIEWDTYIPKDDTNRIGRELQQKLLPPIDRVLSEITNDLKSHLIKQLLLSKIDPVQRQIGAYIIGNLNEDGYLETSIEELWQENPIYELDTWCQTLKLIQNFDPKGVAARDLQECLLIQARSKKEKIYLVENIIKNHWNDFLHRKCDTIAKKLSIPLFDVHSAFSAVSGFNRKKIAVKDLQEYILTQVRLKIAKIGLVEKVIKNQWVNFLDKKCDTIGKSLSVSQHDVRAAYSVVSGFDLRPGQRFNKKVYFNGELSAYRDSVFHVKPDFKIIKNGNGYHIENESVYDYNREHCYIDAIISEYFHRKFKNGDPWMLRDITGYLKSRKNKRKFIDAIVNRHKNTVSTIKCIVRLQKEFFESGLLTSLKPLIARDVAKEIDLDESTVRRIRKNKYVDTPHGIFKLEYFFDQVGVDTLDGRRIASKAVKELIKKIIKSENKATPYSDQKVADILKNNYKIKIMLRTVHNYRESMGILPAGLRKWPC